MTLPFMKRPNLTALLLFTLVVHAGARAQEPAGGDALEERPSGPRVVLEDPGGELKRLALTDFEPKSLAASGAAMIRFEGFEAPARDGDELDLARVRLVGGGNVLAQLRGGEGELLKLELIGRKRLRLAIEELESLVLEKRFPTAWTEPVEAAEEGDRLYRLRGSGVDRIDGAIESFDDQGLTMDTELGSKSFRWQEVAALFIEAFEEQEAPGEGEAVVVDLVDGSRLPLIFQRLGSDGLDLVTGAGYGLRLPLAVVAEVLVVDSGVQFLSELEPERVDVTSPFGDDLGMVWPMRRDRCTSGTSLRAGGRVWTRGIGVHAPSRLEYALDGQWSSLRGFVAIDDEVIPLPANGSAQFRVWGGEELLWESAVLHGGDAPEALPLIDLKGVERLVLEVDMADEMHVGDRADWLRPVLAR